MLRLENVSTFYGNFEAIKSISLEVNQGEMVSLVGANGAGKTTTLRTICGLNRPKKGSVFFQDQEITSLSTVERVRRGLVYCPEGRKLFPEMTVWENLEMGAYLRGDQLEQSFERVFKLFPVLAERRGQMAGSLSGGEQQMLAIGRSLMSDPRLVCFDEPSTGLAPIVVAELMKVIKGLSEEGMTILLVEQNVHFALEIADRAYVIENSCIVLDGDAAQCRDNPHVKEAYLGG